MNRPQIICLTPVKNEAWILDKFLSAASLWADLIIVADQNSTDGSQEIAKKHEKVKLILNESKEFNEPERQKLLINEARKVPGKKILIALDADEFLSGNFMDTDDWSNIMNLPEGTVINFKWPFIKNDFETYWGGQTPNMPFGFVDDGSEHEGKKIHSKRIPCKINSPVYNVNEFVVMHYQFTDWNRMISKHKWYQCYEKVSFPEKSSVEIFRTYSHMYRVDINDFKPIPVEWFSLYKKQGIQIDMVQKQESYYWDREVEVMLDEYGSSTFKNVDLEVNKSILLSYLRLTKNMDSIWIKITDKILKMMSF